MEQHSIFLEGKKFKIWQFIYFARQIHLLPYLSYQGSNSQWDWKNIWSPESNLSHNLPSFQLSGFFLLLYFSLHPLGTPPSHPLAFHLLPILGFLRLFHPRTTPSASRSLVFPLPSNSQVSGSQLGAVCPPWDHLALPRGLGCRRCGWGCY